MSALTEFQDRLKERIKGDIGELMPDEVVKEMIAQALNEEFLKPRTVPNPNYTGGFYQQREITVPPLLLEYLQPQLEGITRKVIGDYLQANPGKLEQWIDEQIGKQIGDFLQKAVASLFQSQFQQFKCQLVSELSQQKY